MGNKAGEMGRTQAGRNLDVVPNAYLSVDGEDIGKTGGRGCSEQAATIVLMIFWKPKLRQLAVGLEETRDGFGKY